MILINRHHKFAVWGKQAAESALGGKRTGSAAGHVEQIQPRRMARLAHGYDDGFTVRRPTVGEGLRFIVEELAGFADTRRQEHQFAWRSYLRNYRLAIRREEGIATVSKANRGGAVGLAQEDTVVAAHCSSSFRKERGLAVGRKIGKHRPIEPGEAALAGAAGGKGGDADIGLIFGQQHET